MQKNHQPQGITIIISNNPIDSDHEQPNEIISNHDEYAVSRHPSERMRTMKTTACINAPFAHFA